MHDTKPAEDVLDFLNNYPGKPLLANAYQENYMPGSSFKVVTTGIALRERRHRRWTARGPSETEWVPPQTNDPIQNYGGTACGGTMAEVFYRSCNIPFAQMAVELGPERMIAGTRCVGHRREAAHRPAGRGGQQLRDANGEPIDFAEQPAAAGHRRLRPGQRPDGAAAHVHGRQPPSPTAGG